MGEKKKSDRERDSKRNLGKAGTNERRSSKVVVGEWSPGRITPPCLEAPLCDEMRMALCT